MRIWKSPFFSLVLCGFDVHFGNVLSESQLLQYYSHQQAPPRAPILLSPVSSSASTEVTSDWLLADSQTPPEIRDEDGSSYVFESNTTTTHTHTCSKGYSWVSTMFQVPGAGDEIEQNTPSLPHWACLLTRKDTGRAGGRASRALLSQYLPWSSKCSKMQGHIAGHFPVSPEMSFMHLYLI